MIQGMTAADALVQHKAASAWIQAHPREAKMLAKRVQAKVDEVAGADR